MADEIQRNIINALRSGLIEIVKAKNIQLEPERYAVLYLERPKIKSHGDYASNVALVLASVFRISPHELAKAIVDQINKHWDDWELTDEIEKIEIDGPGFINFFLTKKAIWEILEHIGNEGPQYGRVNLGQGKKVQIEFVSANPTGPLNVAHGRQAAVGSSLAHILEFAGFEVKKEYYLNDEGNQINLLGRSVQARYEQLCGKDTPVPEGGYHGEYILEIAREIKEKHETRYLDLTEEERLVFLSGYAMQKILSGIKEDLSKFGVDFDLWFSQRELDRSGKVDQTLEILKRKALIYEKDGAVWFKSSAFGDEKDRVVIKSDGSQTYFTPDIAYHRDKFERGFDKVINIWGPDHHGYIPRLKAAVKALGYAEDALQVIIVQLCSLYKGKQQLRMSTRAGEYVTLRQVIDEVGRDAARFFFLMRRTDSHLDFDLELAKKQSPENPVYYIQYAHARICSIMEFARQKKAGQIPAENELNLELLKEEEELDLIKLLGLFPSVVSACAEMLDPQKLTVYLQQVAACFHQFYTKHRVVTEDKNLSEARLFLVNCVRIVIANGLRLVGITAPEKM